MRSGAAPASPSAAATTPAPSGPAAGGKQGYSQVLWLDGVHRKYIEEVGSMNVMFKVDGKVITLALTGSVLPSITRKSCVEMMKSWGWRWEERLITAEELFAAAANGTLEEAQGTGTARRSSLPWRNGLGGQHTVINGGEIGPVAQKLYDNLTGIQWG